MAYIHIIQFVLAGKTDGRGIRLEPS